MARKPTKTQEQEETLKAEIQQQLEPATELQPLDDAVSEMALIQSSYSTEQRQLSALINQRIGRGSAYSMIGKLVTVTDLMDLQQIKETKAYKGFEHIGEDGKPVTVTTWDDYCRLIERRPRESIDRDLLNLSELGEELFESMRQVGLGPAKMRSLRKLPDDHKTALLEAAQTGDKETFVDLAEEFISKSAKEKLALEQQLEEAKAEGEAKEEVAARNRKTIDELQEKLVKVKRLPPDEVLTQMRQEIGTFADEVEMLIRQQLVDAFKTLHDYCIVHVVDESDFLNHRIDLLDQSLLYLRTQIDIAREQDSTEPPVWENFGDTTE